MRPMMTAMKVPLHQVRNNQIPQPLVCLVGQQPAMQFPLQDDKCVAEQQCGHSPHCVAAWHGQSTWTLPSFFPFSCQPLRHVRVFA